MRRLRARKSFVLLGLAVLVFAALVPPLSTGHPGAILTALCLTRPAASITVIRRIAARSDAQPVSLLSVALFRAPPAALAVA